jgi:hypothetical protein
MMLRRDAKRHPVRSDRDISEVQSARLAAAAERRKYISKEQGP